MVLREFLTAMLGKWWGNIGLWVLMFYLFSVCACGKWVCNEDTCDEDEEDPEDDPDVQDVRWF